jgi:HSP20 family protein
MANLPIHHGTRGQMTRQRPRHPLDLLHTQMDELFDRFFGGPFSLFDEEREPMRFWDINVTENGKEIVVRAEMPGFEEKDLDVQLQDDRLVIKAEREQTSDGQEEYRSFSRTLTLPPGIDAEKTQASYRNGVLELHLTRPEGGQPTRIRVQGQQAGTSQSQGQQHPSAKSTTKEGNGSRSSEPAAKPAKK